MKNVFDKTDSAELISRINQLSANQKALWGKMSVAQMLAHCCVSYEMVYENKHPKPNALVKLLLKLFVKKGVVNEKPYRNNGQTAPAFIIKEDKNFEEEKMRLTAFVEKTQTLGAVYFDGKESHSFGKLTLSEWNNMFYKHLDHHLKQFGV